MWYGFLHMKDTQKGFVVQRIIAIIAMIFVAGGVYYYTQTNRNYERNGTLKIAQAVAVGTLKASTDARCLDFKGLKDSTYITYTMDVCVEYTGASGKPCSSYQKLLWGTYFINIENQNGTSNSVKFDIYRS